MTKRQNNVKEPEENAGPIVMSEEAKTAALAAVSGDAAPPARPAPTAPAESIADPDTKAAILGLLKDPEVAKGLLDTVLQTPEGREQLNIPLDQGRPMGIYRRNYDNETHLRVHGGIEVRHGEDFEPRPPSNVPMYISESGGTTDHVESRYENMKDVSGRIVLEDDGRTPRKEMVAEGAKLDAAGRPIKTEGYKAWIDSKMTGRRLDSGVRADIAAGRDPGVEEHFSGDGMPSFVGDDEGVKLASAG